MKKYEWAKDLKLDQLNFLIQLPYTISLPTTPKDNVAKIIVHAGLVAGMNLDH